MPGRHVADDRQDRHFTCDDGSGTLDLTLLVHLTFNPFTDNFVWTAAGGTGSYEHLHAAGTGTVAPQPDGSLIDTYEGVGRTG